MKMDSKAYVTIGIGIASIIGGMILGNIGSQSRTAPPPAGKPPVPHVLKPPSLPQSANQNISVKPPQAENQSSKNNSGNNSSNNNSNNNNSNNNNNNSNHNMNTKKQKTVAEKKEVKTTHVYHPVYHRAYHPVYHKIATRKERKKHRSVDLSYIKEMSVVCKLNQDCRLTDGVKSYKPGNRIGRYYIKQVSLLDVILKTKNGKEIRVRLTQ